MSIEQNTKPPLPSGRLPPRPAAEEIQNPNGSKTPNLKSELRAASYEAWRDSRRRAKAWPSAEIIALAKALFFAELKQEIAEIAECSYAPNELDSLHFMLRRMVAPKSQATERKFWEVFNAMWERPDSKKGGRPDIRRRCLVFAEFLLVSKDWFSRPNRTPSTLLHGQAGSG